MSSIFVLIFALFKSIKLVVLVAIMSDGEMDDVSPHQQSQSFNIADVLSTGGSCNSIGQDSMDTSDGSPLSEINRKSELSVDENTANENLKKLYPFVDQSVSFKSIHYKHVLFLENSSSSLLESNR